MNELVAKKDTDGLSQGRRIKKLRQAADMSQDELAKIVGVGQQAIQKIEADMVERPTCLYQICTALGANVDYIVGGVLPMYAKDGQASEPGTTRGCGAPPLPARQNTSGESLALILSSIASLAANKELSSDDLEFISVFIKKINN